jgi:hypothetical protein
LKHDRPLLCVLDSLGSVQALLGVLLIFFRFAHHGGLRPLVRYRRRLAMTSGYIVADVAIKTAYFSLVAAAVIFVSMLLLAGVHP